MPSPYQPFFLSLLSRMGRQDGIVSLQFSDSYPDPSEVYGLSDQLIVLGYFFLRGKLHKSFTDLPTQSVNTSLAHYRWLNSIFKRIVDKTDYATVT